MSPSRAELIWIISAFDQKIAELKATLISHADRSTKMRAMKMLTIFRLDLMMAEEVLSEIS